MNRSAYFFLALGLALALGPAALGAAGPASRKSEVLWSERVQPLFDVHCVKCHGLIERKSGLELDTPEAIAKGGNDGAVVVPGDPGRSRLYLYLAADSDPHMPPKKQLGSADLEAVRDWIANLSTNEAADRLSDLDPSPRSFGSVTEAIDTLVGEAWVRRGLKPAPALDDRAWARRVYLDLAGRLPTPSELNTFLQDTAVNRREVMVELLLSSDAYAVRMRELWDGLLMGRVKRDAHEDRRRQNGWWTFLEDAFRSNRPWNDVVHAMLAGRAQDPADKNKGASWFLYERRNDHQAIAEAVAPVVYGTRIDCAQCHDHPLAREIKQAHYWGLVAAYNRSKNVEGGAEVGESAIGGFVNFTNLKKESQPAVVALLSGITIEEKRPADGEKEEDSDDKYVDPKAAIRVPKFSRREAFAEAATRDNPLLARAFVNRMWSVLLGRGLVHPADEMTARHTPSHPELLTWLSRDFADHGYDVRRLIRGLVLSRLYSLGFGDAPPDSFAAALERPLSAEQLARSWRVVAGLSPEDETFRRAVTAKFPDIVPRENAANVQQAQFLAYSPALASLLRPEPGGTVARLAQVTDASVRAREAFATVLGREPDREEAGRMESFLEAQSERPADGIRDGLWALMTSAEFLTMP
ncbi:MAG: DUF1549 domain-containing protein [Verrucomicrobiales bacterium]|nr:DUF1549 domain-containing protein [Verrucomicrobiales bacterium]